MHRGYIKLWRKIEDWAWIRDPLTTHLFIHLLLRANHKDYVFMGKPIKRGEVVVGRHKLSEMTGISEQSLRTSFRKLKSTSDITIKSTNKFSVISIVNYAIYQDESTSRTTSKSTFNQPTTNQQLTTIKECKNEKNEKIGNNGQFLESLKSNIAYKGLDLDREMGKCQAWCIANNRVLSKKRFVNWLNRAERPLVTYTAREKKPSQTCTACNGSGKLPDGKKCWCY